jgi:hypothetical protein
MCHLTWLRVFRGRLRIENLYVGQGKVAKDGDFGKLAKTCADSENISQKRAVRQSLQRGKAAVRTMAAARASDADGWCKTKGSVAATVKTRPTSAAEYTFNMKHIGEYLRFAVTLLDRDLLLLHVRKVLELTPCVHSETACAGLECEKARSSCTRKSPSSEAGRRVCCCRNC